MNKIKLFTHDSIDGIGCVIVAEATYGTANVDSEMCTGEEYIEVLNKFFDDPENIRKYSRVYITDLPVTEEFINKIKGYMDEDLVFVFDHHRRVGITHKNYNVQGYNDKWEAVNSTTIFASYMMDVVASECIREDIQSQIYEIATIIRVYDTKEINRFHHMRKREMTSIVNGLDMLIDVCGKRQFIDNIVGRIVHEQMLFTDSDIRICELLTEQRIDYAKMSANEAVIVDDHAVVFSNTHILDIVNALVEMYPDKIAVCVDICGKEAVFGCSGVSGYDMWDYTNNICGSRSGDCTRIHVKLDALLEPDEIVRVIRAFITDNDYRANITSQLYSGSDI